MAQRPIYGPDPDKPNLSAAEVRAEDGAGLAALRAGESDLAELAAKFTAHGGGKVSPELSADLALEIVLNEIVEQACLATGASGAAIVLERGGEWVCRASAGGTAPELGARLDAEAGLSGACVKTRTVQRCEDAQADPRADIEACRNLGVRSVIILPLLQNDKLTGVFEVFWSRPLAFGERDERTLEALSLRVLRNLERASEPLSAGQALEDVRAVPQNSIRENTWEKMEVTSEASSGLADRSAEPSSASVGSASLGSADPTMADLRSADATLLEPASEEELSRGLKLITWALGAAVLGFAVLLTVRVGQRLVGGTAAVRAHPLNVVSASATGTGSQMAAQGRAAIPLASENKSASSAQVSGSASGVAGSGATHSTGASAPAGSLLIYENGKEVFRAPPSGAPPDLPPVQEQRESKVERASAIEEDRAAGVPAASAEDGILHRVEPEYPEEARQKGIEGPVVVDLDIGRDGRVLEAKVVSGPPLLTQAVIDAVKQWVFKPHSVNGELVPMQTRITLTFRLPH